MDHLLVKFNDPKFKNEIFVRIDMKHSYFSTICLQSMLLKLLLFAKNYFMFMHKSNKSNFVNILMYVILACHLFM